jgi:hypothetical protein
MASRNDIRAEIRFLDRRSHEFYRDRDGIAHTGVGSVRAEAGRNPTTWP